METTPWYYQAEYEKLKEEQIARIGFRDNMVYVALGAVGAVSAFAIAVPSRQYAFLLVPWLGVVLGWLYLVNDHKISAIGDYLYSAIRHLPKEGQQTEMERGWEAINLKETRRRQRKVFQLAIDITTFVLPGIAALAAFLWLSPPTSVPVWLLVLAEGVLIVVLGWQFALYADFRNKRCWPEEQQPDDRNRER